MSARRRGAIVWVMLVATMAVLGGLVYEYRADLFPDMTVNKLVVNSTTDLETLTSCIRLPTDGDGTLSCGTDYTWTDLASYPAACAASNWVRAVGDTLTCAQPAEADISDLSHVHAADGANCGAGEIPAGVDTAGAVQGCDATPAVDLQDATGLVESGLNADESPTNNDILTYDSTGANFSWQTPAEIGVVTGPAGSDTHIQYNDTSAFGAEAAFTYDNATNIMSVDTCNLGTAANDTEDYITTRDGFYGVQFQAFDAVENTYAPYPMEVWTDANDDGTADDVELKIDSDTITVGTAGDDDTTMAIFGRFTSTCNPTACTYSGPLQFDNDATITASTTQTQGQGVLDCDLCNVSVVANDNDVVTMPAGSIQGRRVSVKNDDAAQILQVFPNTSQDLGEGVNTSTTLDPGWMLVCEGLEAAVWACDRFAPVGTGEGAYGSIHVENSSTATTVSSANTEYQITIFDTDGPEYIDDADHTNDHITITSAGTYMINVSMTIESAAGAAYEIECEVFTNNGAAHIDGLHFNRDMAGGGGDVGSASMSGIAVLSAADTIEIWCENLTNTTNFTVQDANLSLFRIK